ncbi:MAG: HDOD domain-containing protein [Syntrophobacteraceae bacterium]
MKSEITAGPRKSTDERSAKASGSEATSKAARIVQIMGDLPTMPHIATQVMEKLSNPNSTPRDIHDLITKDQGLAAHVLKVANSPYYGASRSISSLKDAVLFMGFDSIRSLITTAVLKGMFSALSLSEQLLWEHAIGCGVAAKQIGDAIGFQATEEAYLAGLMHDVGKAALFLRAPSQMREIMQEVYNNQSANFADLEQQKLGFDHAEVGQIMADEWRFSIDIEDAIAHHHRPDQAKSSGELSYIVSLANLLCHKLEIGPTRRPNLDLFESESAKALDLSPDSLSTIIEKVSGMLKEEKIEGI